MIVKGTLKAIGSGRIGGSGWGHVNTIEFYENIPELKGIVSSKYLFEKLDNCIGKEIELFIYGKRTLLGIKTSTKTYTAKPGLGVFFNSLGAMGGVFMLGTAFLATTGVGLILSAGYYFYKIKDIKKAYKEEFSVTF